MRIKSLSNKVTVFKFKNTLRNNVINLSPFNEINVTQLLLRFTSFTDSEDPVLFF